MAKKPGYGGVNNRDKAYYKRQRRYESRPDQKKNRSERTLARYYAKKAGKVKVGDGKDIHHKKPIRSGGTNSPKNLKVMDRSKNRGWRKGKKGSLTKK